MLVLLATMAVLDLISIGIVVGFDPEVTSSAAEAWWYYTMLVFDTPWTQTAIGFVNGPPEDLAELIRPGGRGRRSCALVAAP